jgi:hypothetical protein
MRNVDGTPEDSRERTEARRKATALGLPCSVISHQVAP